MKKINYFFTIIASGIIGGIVGFCWSMRSSNRIMETKNARIDKFVGYFNLLNQWMDMREEGKSVVDYFKKFGYQKIAIYGLGKMAKHLLKELEDSNIQVMYAIDANGGTISSDINVYTLEDEIQKVDVIVITATFDYDSIKNDLEEKTNIPIVSLDDVLYEFL